MNSNRITIEKLGHLQTNRKVTQNNCTIVKNNHGTHLVIAGRCFNLCGPNSKHVGHGYPGAAPSDGSHLARFCRSNERIVNRPSMRFAESCFSVQGVRYGSNMMVANSRFASVGKIGPTVETPQKITECMKLEVFDLEKAEEELRAS